MRTGVTYSEDISQLWDKSSRNCIIHLLCLSGDCHLLYNGQPLHICRNDLLVLSRADLITSCFPGEQLSIELITAPTAFISSLMPSNHYGIGGGVSLFRNPRMPLTEEEAVRLHTDIQHIRNRLNDSDMHFYLELMTNLIRTMIYDIFEAHFRLNNTSVQSDRTTDFVSQLMQMFATGSTRTNRHVSYYADKLRVSPKYLSDTVRRTTGHSVVYLINRYTIPILRELLDDSKLSLTQIADIMNFSSISYFSRYVQKHLGQTPSMYRASNQPIHK